MPFGLIHVLVPNGALAMRLGPWPFPPLRVAATEMKRSFRGKMPADGTLAARCPREAFGTILVAAKPAKKLHLIR
jgi:hypothetical protein